MNIIVIKTDEQRFDTLGCMGNPFIRTPNIDRLATQGAVCDNAFCVSPLCVPSRVSFFTGQYVHRTGCTSNAHAKHIGIDQWSFIETLKDNGYAIGLAGKNHAFKDAYFDRFFDYREEYGHWGKTHGEIRDTDREVRDYRHDEKRPGYNTKSGMLMEGLIEGPEPFPEEQCMNWRIAEDSARFVEQHQNRPFFLHMSFPDPHWPNLACEPYHSMYDPMQMPLDGLEIDWDSHPFAHYVQSQSSGFDAYNYTERAKILAIYYGQITAIDRAVGMLLDKLEELQLTDETIVVFTSDHGDLAGRFALISKTKAFYEPLIRIPLILRIPERAQQGQRIAAQISNIDVMPTIMDALGVCGTDAVQGRSFLPVLDGHTDTHRTEIFAEVGSPNPPPPPVPKADYPAYNRKRCEKDGVFWFTDYTTNGRTAMVRRNNWKYCYYTGDTEELYDLGTDPIELHNLAGRPEHAGKQAELKDRLMDWLLTTPYAKM